MYTEAIQYLFHKIPVQLTKPLSPRGKRQSLSDTIGGDLYMKNNNENISPLKK